jgi:hypothetical protein
VATRAPSGGGVDEAGAAPRGLMSSWSPRARVAIAPRRAGTPHTQDSAIVPVTTTSRERPRTATVALASSVSSPRNSPASNCWRTALTLGGHSQGLEELPNRHVEGLFLRPHCLPSYARREAQPRAPSHQPRRIPTMMPFSCHGTSSASSRKPQSAAFVEEGAIPELGACWSSIASVSRPSTGTALSTRKQRSPRTASSTRNLELGPSASAGSCSLRVDGEVKPQSEG